MSIEPVDDERRLRIAVLGDIDGVHTRSWLRWFVERGHDVHAISYYTPRAQLEGVRMHVLRPGGAGGGGAGAGWLAGRVPRGVLRLAHGLRYRRAGVARAVREIAPDVLHGHFVVEHGFYGLMAGFRPYVVTAWGSDVLVEPRRDPVSKRIAAYTLRHADAVTSNNAYMAERMIELGADRAKTHVIVLGADRYFLEASPRSVNVREGDPARAPAIISTRAHEPLYNIGEVIDAYGRVVRLQPAARLVLAHGGSLTSGLQRQASGAGGRVEFYGFLDRAAFREALSDAEVFVSVPSSDGTSVALLQAMAAGCFPIVSDLPTQREWVEDGVNGFRVPPHRPDLLADRIGRALGDPALRRDGAERNRAIVEARGLNENEMMRMEAVYLRLREASRSRC